MSDAKTMNSLQLAVLDARKLNQQFLLRRQDYCFHPQTGKLVCFSCNIQKRKTECSLHTCPFCSKKVMACETVHAVYGKKHEFVHPQWWACQICMYKQDPLGTLPSGTVTLSCLLDPNSKSND
jgi:hypothetical protein